MDTYFLIIELVFFFVAYLVLLKIGTTINFYQYFQKGKIKEMQLLYFIVMFILAYLLSSGLAHLLQLSYDIIN